MHYRRILEIIQILFVRRSLYFYWTFEHGYNEEKEKPTIHFISRFDTIGGKGEYRRDMNDFKIIPFMRMMQKHYRKLKSNNYKKDIKDDFMIRKGGFISEHCETIITHEPLFNY